MPRYFFAGEALALAAGLALVAPAFALAAALGEAEAAGETEVAGDAEVAAAAEADGEGVGVAVSTGAVTTERPPVIPGKEKIIANNIKMTAAVIVAFSKGFCAPRGPKAV